MNTFGNPWHILFSILTCFFVCTLLTIITWFLFTRIYKQFVFKWQGPVLMGLFVSLLFSFNHMFSVYQTKQLLERWLPSTPAQAQNQAQPVDPVLQMKSELLKVIDTVTKNPALLTEETKGRIFTNFAPLFSNSKEGRQAVGHSLLSAYQCQQYFLEDAIKSYQTKKVAKSEARKKCEEFDGKFFNREKLLPVDVVKSNDETLRMISERKRLPAANGQAEEITDKTLQTSLEEQKRAIGVIKSIFE